MRKKRRRALREKLNRAGLDYCPLCLRKFGSGVKKTLEHVPPKALGGDATCYTCEDCNTFAGRLLESHFSDYHLRKFNVILRSHDGVKLGEAKLSLANGGIDMGTFPEHANWMKGDALENWERVDAYMPAKELIYRAYAKFAYLAVGCLTGGRIWREYWTTPIRNYILNGGDIPIELDICEQSQLGRKGLLIWLEPYIGRSGVDKFLLCWCWSVGWEHVQVSLIPFPEFSPMRSLSLALGSQEGRTVPCYGDVGASWYVELYNSVLGSIDDKHAYPVTKYPVVPLLDTSCSYQVAANFAENATKLYRLMSAPVAG